MRLGYSPPVPTADALVGGAGASWLTADGAAACYDDNPARKARLQWRNDAVPAIAHYVEVDFTIPSTPLGICAILGLTGVPAGAVVHVYGKRAADAGVTWDFGGQNTATVVQFADGTYGAWFVLPAGAAAVEKVGFRFYNNAAGATWATAATTIDIGELAAMPAVEIPIDRGWSQQRMDPSTRSLSRGSAPITNNRRPYRELRCVFSRAPEASVRFGGLANGMDWDRLEAALGGNARCVVIPRAADQARINATAQYGIAGSIGATQHLSGPFWSKEMTFQEVPAA